jgi:hypothetical protein
MCDGVTSCVIGSVVDQGFSGIAQSAGQGAGELLGQAMTWWVNTPSVDPNSAAVHNLQQYTLPLAAMVLVGSILVQAMRMVVTRRKDPAINVAVGLIRYALVTALGLTVLQLALQGFDSFAQYLVAQTIPEFANRLKGLLTGVVLTNSFSLFALSAVLFVLAAIQWVLGFLRQAGILVLAVMLPLAASGSINDSTKSWLNRLVPWLLSLVLYKFVAAMIYAIGFTMMGQGQDISTVMTGLMVLVLAVIALPTLMKFFSWGYSSVSGGGAGGVVASGAMGAVAVSQLAGRGGAVQSASSMDRSGPGSNSASAGPSGSSAASQLTSGAPATTTAATGPRAGGGGSGGSTGSDSAGGRSAGETAGNESTRGSTSGGPSSTAPGGSGAAADGAAGTAAGTGGAAGAGSGAAAGTAAAAAGPAGAAAGAATQLARGAYQAGQSAAEQLGDDGGQQ